MTDTTTALLSFAAVVGLLTVTPGLDTALVLRTAALGQRRRAWGVVLGIQCGTLAWGVAASLGVSALLTASTVAYETLRWAGVCYLLWMGGRMVWSSLRRAGTASVALTQEAAPSPGGLLAGIRRGALTNLLNPKVGVFYIALLPQFIPDGASHLAFGTLLTSIHILFGTVWSGLVVAFARVLRRWLTGARARRVMDRVTGGVVIGFGVKLATGE
jgi:threonine/homoserine/homoserine lactone efflux protein